MLGRLLVSHIPQTFVLTLRMAISVCFLFCLASIWGISSFCSCLLSCALVDATGCGFSHSDQGWSVIKTTNRPDSDIIGGSV